MSEALMKIRPFLMTDGFGISQGKGNSWPQEYPGLMRPAEAIFLSESVTVQLAVPPPHLSRRKREVSDIQSFEHGSVAQDVAHEQDALAARKPGKRRSRNQLDLLFLPNPPRSPFTKGGRFRPPLC